jgi:hypothetical protein
MLGLRCRGDDRHGKSQDYSTGCIGMCAGKNPELAGKYYGFLNGEFTVCNTKEVFFDKIAAAVKN